MQLLHKLFKAPGTWQAFSLLSTSALNLVLQILYFKSLGSEFIAHWNFAVTLNAVLVIFTGSTVDPVVNLYLKRNPKSLSAWLVSSFLVKFSLTSMAVAPMIIHSCLAVKGSLDSVPYSWVRLTLEISAFIGVINPFGALLSNEGGRSLIRNSLAQLLVNVCTFCLKCYALSSLSIGQAAEILLSLILAESASSVLLSYWFSRNALDRDWVSYPYSLKRRVRAIASRFKYFLFAAGLNFASSRADFFLVCSLFDFKLLGPYTIAVKFIDVLRQAFAVFNSRLYQRICNLKPGTSLFTERHRLVIFYSGCFVGVSLVFISLAVTPVLLILGMSSSLVYLYASWINFMSQSLIRSYQYKWTLANNLAPLILSSLALLAAVTIPGYTLNKIGLANSPESLLVTMNFCCFALLSLLIYKARHYLHFRTLAKMPKHAKFTTSHI